MQVAASLPKDDGKRIVETVRQWKFLDIIITGKITKLTNSHHFSTMSIYVNAKNKRSGDFLTYKARSK